ncbi:C39 family peptidase [Bacillus sp. DNRA2]|uniref:C39 family peptidase n=1 Tax=Bacillus sp. DNRA2 TaxID=2723053 RepID=UPI002006E8DE|nr:C39 family peptidase [Bacillus sp. DNRA2]
MAKVGRLSLGMLIIALSVYFSIGTFQDDELYFNISEENIEAAEEVKIAQEALLNVPLLNQMDAPQLKSGCEVTSLAMLLSYKGVEVSKNQLADEIAKVPFKYPTGENGNPNFGFVGDMANGAGLGVYNRPIAELAEKYAGDRVINLTNQPFDVLLNEVAAGNPVWILTTKSFAPVSDFKTWETPQGVVDITYSMHSVVITGYEPENIIINNPYGQKNQKWPRDSFIQAWQQMGSQAIVIR